MSFVKGGRSSNYNSRYQPGYPYKTPFTFPTTTTTTEATIDSVVSTVQSIVTDVFENGIKTDPSVVVNTTFNSSVIEATQDANNTIAITEITQEMSSMETVTNFIIDETERTVSNLTEESANTANAVTEGIDWIMKNATETFEGHHDHKEAGSYTTIYVIIGVLLAILIIVSMVLIYVYIRYRKVSLLCKHKEYNLSQASSSKYEQEQSQIRDQDIIHGYKC